MGGFLTIGYCFPCRFPVIFVGGQGCDGGNKVVIRESPQSPHWEKPCFVVPDFKNKKEVLELGMGSHCDVRPHLLRVLW